MKLDDNEYLENMKEARNKWIDENNLTYDKIVSDELCDKARIAMALEIIAETLIGIYDRMCSQEGMNVDVRES